MGNVPTQFSVELMQELQRAQEAEVAQLLRNCYLSTPDFLLPVMPDSSGSTMFGYQQRQAARRYHEQPYPRPRASAVWDGTETRRLVHEYGGGK